MKFFVVLLFFLPWFLSIWFFIKWLKLKKANRKLVPRYELLLHMVNGKIVFSGIDYPILVPTTQQSSFDGSIIRMYFDKYDDAQKELLNFINQKNIVR